MKIKKINKNKFVRFIKINISIIYAFKKDVIFHYVLYAQKIIKIFTFNKIIMEYLSIQRHFQTQYKMVFKKLLITLIFLKIIKKILINFMINILQKIKNYFKMQNKK